MKESGNLKRKKLVCLLLGICCILPNALAGDTYTIDRYVISSGGGISNGGGYSLQASIAQTITASSNGDVYELSSGYWHENTDLIFKNSFE